MLILYSNNESTYILYCNWWDTFDIVPFFF